MIPDDLFELLDDPPERYLSEMALDRPLVPDPEARRLALSFNGEVFTLTLRYGATPEQIAQQLEFLARYIREGTQQ